MFVVEREKNGRTNTSAREVDQDETDWKHHLESTSAKPRHSSLLRPSTSP